MWSFNRLFVLIIVYKNSTWLPPRSIRWRSVNLGAFLIEKMITASQNIPSWPLNVGVERWLISVG